MDARGLTCRATTAASVAVALCVLAASCEAGADRPPPTIGDASSSLTLPGKPNPATAGMPAPMADAPISIGMGSVVCLSKPGVATIVAVHPFEPTENFELQDFATRPNPSLVGEFQLGGEPGSLQEVGFDPDADQVDEVCDGAGSGYELAVQLARTGTGVAVSHGFDIDWESGANSGTLRIPLGVLLCDARTSLIPRCDITEIGP